MSYTFKKLSGYSDLLELSPKEQLDVSAALDGEDELGWSVEEAMCDRCSREWIAVYPIGAEAIECPGCQYEQPSAECRPN